MSSDQNPFASPEHDEDAQHDELGERCPYCGQQAERGQLSSGMSLNWISPNQSGLQKFLHGGERIAGKGFLSSGQLHGLYCRSCERLIIDLKEDGQGGKIT